MCAPWKNIGSATEKRAIAVRKDRRSSSIPSGGTRKTVASVDQSRTQSEPGKALRALPKATESDFNGQACGIAQSDGFIFKKMTHAAEQEREDVQAQRSLGERRPQTGTHDGWSSSTRRA